MVKKEVFVFDAASSFHSIFLETDAIPLNIHYHAEYELTLTVNSSGVRHIAGAVTEYRSPDLVLIAPGQPHSWRSVDQEEDCYRYIILFPAGWISQQVTHGLAEFAGVEALFRQAEPGIAFSPRCAGRCLPFFQSLEEEQNPLSKLSTILQILTCLTEDTQAVQLTSLSPVIQSHQRLDKALRYIQANFTQAIEINDVASAVYCSPSTLKRDFRLQMGIPFSRYLNGLRVQHACHLLLTTDLALSHIAERCGFGSRRQFFRSFSQIRQTTPQGYRKQGRR